MMGLPSTSGTGLVHGFQGRQTPARHASVEYCQRESEMRRLSCTALRGQSAGGFHVADGSGTVEGSPQRITAVPSRGEGAPGKLLAERDSPAVPSGERDEVAILRDAVAGEPVAVRILLDVHLPTVYGFVHARLGGRQDNADDIMQETLEEAVRSAHTFRGESSLATWLCAIARRRLARYYERERRAEEAGRWLVAVADPQDDVLDRRDEVVRALGALPPSQRQALVLKYLDDLTVEQVATQMGKTVVQVQSLLQRGRDGLKKELERVRG